MKAEQWRLGATAKKNRRVQSFAYMALGIVAAAVILPIFALFGFIVYNGIGKINWSFLTEAPDAMGGGGIFPALVGTIYLVLGTILIALPLGICAAIYLSEYAGSGKLVRAIRLSIVNLAGVPSIVQGLFGLGFFVLFIGGGIDKLIYHSKSPIWGQPCLFWGSCTLAVVILPIIITTTEEALKSVPGTFREASLGMGATKWQTIRRVILPSALPGILTGSILGVGRAAGETAPVMLTCAASFKPGLPQGMNDQAMLLPYHLYFVVTQIPNPKLDLEAGIALVLIAFVFVVSLAGIIIRGRMRRMRKW